MRSTIALMTIALTQLLPDLVPLDSVSPNLARRWRAGSQNSPRTDWNAADWMRARGVQYKEHRLARVRAREVMVEAMSRGSQNLRDVLWSRR